MTKNEKMKFLKSLEWATNGHEYWFTSRFKLTKDNLYDNDQDIFWNLSKKNIENLNDHCREAFLKNYLTNSNNLTFKFNSSETARHFKDWFCVQGEQIYRDWMEYREQESEDNITALNFNYWNKDGSIIPTICGRMDEKE